MSGRGRGNYRGGRGNSGQGRGSGGFRNNDSKCNDNNKKSGPSDSEKKKQKYLSHTLRESTWQILMTQ